MTTTAPAIGFPANTEGREMFRAVISAAIEAGQYEYAIRRVIAEGPALGRRKAGWLRACQWFEDAAAEHGENPQWIALQGNTWLGYGNL